MSIYSEVLSFIRRPDPACFEALALRVFRYQFDTVAPYRDYCLGRGASRDAVGSLGDIPAVSTVAFKYAELKSAPPERVFLTSGTTGGERGRHFVPRLEVYKASAVAHLARMLFPDRRRTRMLALHPTADVMPESSLGQMISWCIDEFGAGPSLSAATARGIILGAARGFLLEAELAHEPVCILGTTAAFAALFENLRQSGRALKLAAGSRLMDTGGAKGQATPLGADEVAALAAGLLGIAPALAINEYGMTEMCSQLYDATSFNSGGREPPGRRLKLAPPWLSVVTIDPVTLARLDDGQVGLLSYFDLANVGSVSALLTEDLGAVEGNAVRIIGRAEASEARGCALAIEQFARHQYPAVGSR